MNLTHPEWLLLLPALMLLGLVWKKLALFTPLRLLALLLLSLALTKPTYNSLEKHLDLWVLLDRSNSTENAAKQGLPEWKKIIEHSKPSKKDKIRYVDYASSVSLVEEGGERATYTGNRNLSRTALALQDILARQKENRPTRILLFTDGYATEPLHEVAEKLTNQGIPVDFRLIGENHTHDYRITSLEMPTQVQANESFIITATVKGHTDGEIPIHISQNDQLLKQTKVRLKQGKAEIQFSTKIKKPGSYCYTARIHPKLDKHEGNNKRKRWIQITGGPQVLLVSNYKNDPLIKVLKKQHYQVNHIQNSKKLNPGQLAGVKSVIFNNIPAHEVPSDFLESLDFFVKEQGGGFLMVGGKRSFAAGGYFRSSIDSLLPVTMELKNDHRKLSVALAIVMDRSGSMGMSVNAGGANLTKMDLANNGAAEAIRLLGRKDEIAIYAVDSEPTTIVPLQPIKNKQKELIKKAQKIVSSGGGIYVYNGLSAAWKDLKQSKIHTKHIILFSDASDTEQPDKYRELIDEIIAKNGTISVIGLGKATDTDAQLLEDIAKRGKGRIFFSTNPLEIPKLFAQETVTLARSAFITDITNTRPIGHWRDISPSNEKSQFSFLKQIDAYNLTYARPNSLTSLITKDDYKAPLISHWKRGMGRTAAITFPLGGKHSERARTWKNYGTFIQTMLNWLNGDNFPPGLTLRHRLNGTRLQIDLFYDTQSKKYNWTQIFAHQAPKIILELENGEKQYLSWKRIAPGHYTLQHDLEEGTLVKGAVQAGEHALAFGPLSIGSTTEWTFNKERLADLRALALQTGGRELTDLSKVWQRPEISKPASMLPILSILLLTVLILEALQTRTGWQFNFSGQLMPALIKLKQRLPQHNKNEANKVKQKISVNTQPSNKNQPKTTQKNNTKEKATTQKTTAIQVKQTETKEKTQESRSSRFARAKKRR